MDIKKIRGQIAYTLGVKLSHRCGTERCQHYDSCELCLTDQILSTEIVPERECPDCEGKKEYDRPDYFGEIYPQACTSCNGTGKLSPVTVEQAIRDKLKEG